MLWAQGTAGTGRLVRAYGPPSGVASPPLLSEPAGPHVPLGSPVQKERLRCHTGPEVGLFQWGWDHSRYTDRQGGYRPVMRDLV